MSNFTAFSWTDEDQGLYGPGLSRPKDGERTKEFKLEIVNPGCRPLTWVTQAPNRREALKYAKNRWPLCIATVLK